MKKIFVLMVATLMVCATTMAKELKMLVVTTTPAVQSVEAQTKVKDQLRLTPETNAKKIVAALKKNGYEATVVSDGAPKEKKEVPVDATSGASQQQKK